MKKKQLSALINNNKGDWKLNLGANLTQAGLAAKVVKLDDDITDSHCPICYKEFECPGYRWSWE